MTTFTDGFGGDVQTYCDTILFSSGADTNYATYTELEFTFGTEVALIKFNLSSIPDDATIDSATLYLYQSRSGLTRPYTATIYRIKAANTAWTETGATWNHAVHDTNEWAGGQNGCSVSGTDHEAAEIGHFDGDRVNGVGFEYVISLDVDQITTMLTADYGMIIKVTNSGSNEDCASSDYATTGYRPKLVIEYTEAPAEIVGTTCWGHVTGVSETNVQTFAGNWTGDGAISGAGDGETICLNAGEYMESEVVNTGDMYVELSQNVYAAGDTIAIKYRTGATVVACEAEGWTAYTVPFLSLGYSQVRIESTL